MFQCLGINTLSNELIIKKQIFINAGKLDNLSETDLLYNIVVPGIVRIPKLYANFVEDQYMSVFAIALPYTNPFK